MPTAESFNPTEPSLSRREPGLRFAGHIAAGALILGGVAGVGYEMFEAATAHQMLDNGFIAGILAIAAGGAIEYGMSPKEPK